MRVNMDSSIATGSRFKRLRKLLGVSRNETAGACYHAWLECYDRRQFRIESIDLDIAADIDGFSEALVSVGLATRFNEVSIEVHGVRSRIEFLQKQAKRGAAGGRKSGESRRREASASGKESERLVDPEAVPEAYTLTLTPDLTLTQDQTCSPEANEIESKSKSNNSNEVSTERASAFDLESAYKPFPRKQGKSAGMKKLRRQIRTAADFAKFSAAVEAMAQLWANASAEQLAYAPLFSTWVSQERWRDDEQLGPASNGRNGTQAPRSKPLRDVTEECGGLADVDAWRASRDD